MVGNAPQVAMDTEPPLPHPDDNAPKEIVIERRGSSGGSHLRRIWVATFTLIGVLALSLGCGLGIGLRSDLTSTNPTGTPTTVPTPTTTAVPPPIQPTNGALNDTSLSAIQLANGDRHLFFQDINSTLRHAVFSKAFNKWLDSVDFIIPERPPRSHTPLTTLDMNADPSLSADASMMLLCYIDINDTLAVTSYNIYNGQNSIDGPFWNTNDSFRVSTSARSLGGSVFVTNSSVDSVPNPSSEILLFYVNPTNNITLLHGYLIANGSASSLIWQNISDTLFYSADYLSRPASRGWLGPPFSISNHDGGFDGVFFNPQSAFNRTAETTLSRITCTSLWRRGETIVDRFLRIRETNIKHRKWHEYSLWTGSHLLMEGHGVINQIRLARR